MPFVEIIGGPLSTFQHENAFIHAANRPWEVFLNNSVHAILWPSASSHLNPIKNAWRLLFIAVYLNRKTYTTISELKTAITSIGKKSTKNIKRFGPLKIEICGFLHLNRDVSITLCYKTEIFVLFLTAFNLTFLL